jgi:hypothetical protein
MPGKEIWITVPKRLPFKNVYQLKITLRGIEPEIWRRILVPESYTFYDLHVAIQDAMGWEDYHLHRFEVRDIKAPAGRVIIETPFAEPEDDEILESTEVPLSVVFQKPGDRAVYIYDYGDNWVHDVVLEKIEPKEPKKKYPLCLAGERACPPEDCGGVSGYYRCLEAFRNKDDSQGVLSWLGDWDPDKFDPAQVKFESPRKRFEAAGY